MFPDTGNSEDLSNNKKSVFKSFFLNKKTPINSMDRWNKAGILAGFAIGIIGAFTLVELRKTRILGEKQSQMNKEASDQLIAIKEVKHGLRTPQEYNKKYRKDKM